MNGLYVEKYRASGKLTDGTLSKAILCSFEAMHAGRARIPEVFAMYRDDDVRAVLDDEDYAEWVAKRKEAMGE